MSSSVYVLCPCFIRSMVCVCVLGTFKLYSRIWNVIRAGDFTSLHFYEGLEEDVVVNPEDRDSVKDDAVQPEHERDDGGLQASVFSTLQGLLSNTVSVNSYLNSAASVELGNANATPDPACGFARYFCQIQ